MSKEMQKFTAALNSFVGAPRGSRRNPKVSTAVHGPVKFKMTVNNANYTVSVSPDGHAMAVLDSADWRDVSPKRVVVSSATDALNKASAIQAEVKEARKRAFDGGFYDRFGRMSSGTSEEFRRLDAEADVYEHLAYALNTRNQYIPANMNPRARLNMAIRKHGAEFDTVEELVAYEKAMGISSPRAPRAVSAAASAPAPRAPRLRGTPKEAELPTRRREWSGELREPEGKPGYEQAKMIGVSIGGIGSYCPDLAGVAVKGGAHVEALSRMGLTKAKASAVIDEMKRRGVVYGKTAQQQAVAREILATVGGVVCPSPVAAKNPAFWQRAY